MTSKASSTFLFATLVLSSGVCLSDAFSTTNLPSRSLPSTTSSLTRFYAPKDSLEGPKRRRPRKLAAATTPKKATRARSSTTEASASASGAEVRSSAKGSRPQQQQRAKRKKIKPRKKSNTAGDYVMGYLLNHELLSKEEEFELAVKMRRASQLQETMTAWIDKNKARIEQRQQYQRMESLYLSEMDMDNPLLGSASSQAVERFYTEEDDLLYPYGSPLEEEEEEDYLDGYTVYQQQVQQPSPSVPESWMDEILMQRDDHLSVDSILTDEDIRQVLKLKGGRSELRAVLLEGAVARDKLIRSNIKLVYSIAKKWVGEDRRRGDKLVRAYASGRPTLDEAMQEGMMGLAEAAERFDPDRGFRFATYATMWVTNEVRKCFQQESTSGLRLPVPYYEMKTKYVKLAREYIATKNEVPPIAEMAEEIGVSVPRLVAALRLTQPLQSLDAPVSGLSQGSAGAGKAGFVGGLDGGYTLAALLPSEDPEPEDICERSLLRQCLENAMATELSPNERDVVRLRLGLDDGVPQTAKEVADIFGGRFSQAAIRGMEQRALNKLRSPFAVHTQQLLAYLDFAGIDAGTLRR